MPLSTSRVLTTACGSRALIIENAVGAASVSGYQVHHPRLLRRFELVGYGLNTRKVVGDSAPLPESAVVEEHAVQRIWEGRVLRAGNHRRPADDTNVAGPLAHGRVAGAGALIDRPRRCGRGDRGQSDLAAAAAVASGAM